MRCSQYIIMYHNGEYLLLEGGVGGAHTGNPTPCIRGGGGGGGFNIKGGEYVEAN